MSESPLGFPLKIYEPFDVRESARLRTFVADVEELVSCSFFDRPGATVTLEWQQRSGELSTEIDEIPEEAIRAVIPIFRQLWSHTEPTSMQKIVGVLAEHTRAHLSEHRESALSALKEFRQRERQILRGEGQPRLVMDGEHLTPRVLIDLFLHGHYLHKGNDKSEKLARWPLADLTRFVFLSAIVQLRNLYIVAANVVRRVLAEPLLTNA